MITGYNTDIEHAGRVYHVQTEDKGVGNPVVESLIYCGGEIVTSRRSAYGELSESERYPEEEVQRRMEQQHQNLIREIRLGKFDPDEPMPFGHEVVTSRSFDEVVDGYLREEDGRTGNLTIRVMDWQVLEEGTRPTMRMLVRDGDSESAIAGATVRVWLEATDRDRAELFSATTDQQGFVEASFEIPEPAGESAQIVCEAVSGGATEHFRQRVKGTRLSR